MFTRIGINSDKGGFVWANSIQVIPKDHISTLLVYSCSQTSSGAYKVKENDIGENGE